jgi:hypothetical protein
LSPHGRYKRPSEGKTALDALHLERKQLLRPRNDNGRVGTCCLAGKKQSLILFAPVFLGQQQIQERLFADIEAQLLCFKSGSVVEPIEETFKSHI